MTALRVWTVEGLPEIAAGDDLGELVAAAVGDTLADLKCAHAAGCVPVLVGGPEALPAALMEYPPRLRARDCHALMALL